MTAPSTDNTTASSSSSSSPTGDASAGHTPRGPVERLVLGAINLYRMTAPARIPRCRYVPSCSAYAVEAVEVHGLGRGSWLAVRRLGRCHPFGSFGFDPVPERRDRSATGHEHDGETTCDHPGHHQAPESAGEHHAPENSNPPERT